MKLYKLKSAPNTTIRLINHNNTVLGWLGTDIDMLKEQMLLESPTSDRWVIVHYNEDTNVIFTTDHASKELAIEYIKKLHAIKEE
jgi:hypothetical protein